MPRKKITLPELIIKAGELFRLRGYHNTSIADIAAHCGLQKASIYHHVTSKKQLMLLTMDQLHQHFKENIFSIAYDDAKDGTERLNAFTDSVEAYFLECQGGCLLANLTLELGNSDDEFIEQCQQYFNDWQKALTHIISNEKSAQDAEQIAATQVAFTQGAIMMNELYKDATWLKRISQHLKQIMENHSQAAQAI